MTMRLPSRPVRAALQTILPVLLLLGLLAPRGLHAQDRIRGMPGYDRYTEMGSPSSANPWFPAR